MREKFFVGTIKVIIFITRYILNVNVGFGSMYLTYGMTYGSKKKGTELEKQWEEDLNESARNAWMRNCVGNLVNPSMRHQAKNFSYISSNSMQDAYDFYYIMEPGFRCVKESIFDTIDFLTADEFIDDVHKQIREYLMKEKIRKADYIDVLMSKFNSEMINKLNLYLGDIFSQAIKKDRNNAGLFNEAISVLNQKIIQLISEFKRKNDRELTQACQDNTKEAIITNILEFIKSKFFLFDCCEQLIPEFYKFLYEKSQKDLYFRFFGKKNEQFIAVEKEKNMIYKRLHTMRSRMELYGDINNIFIPLASEDKSSQSLDFFSVFCTTTAEVRINSKKGKLNLQIFFSTILTDEFKMFQPAFLFSEDIFYFGCGFSTKINSEFIDYGGLFVDIQVFHILFIDLTPFFPEFLLDYANHLIGSSNKFSLSEIIRKEHQSLSDNTKKTIMQTSTNTNIWWVFLHELYKVYVGKKYLKGKLIISAFEISLYSFNGIYNLFLEEIKTKSEIFSIGDEEMKKCCDFFFNCILFKMEYTTGCFKLENILRIEVEKIKE